MSRIWVLISLYYCFRISTQFHHFGSTNRLLICKKRTNLLVKISQFNIWRILRVILTDDIPLTLLIPLIFISWTQHWVKNDHRFKLSKWKLKNLLQSRIYRAPVRFIHNSLSSFINILMHRKIRKASFISLKIQEYY